MNYKIITLFVLSIIIVTSLSFEDAFALNYEFLKDEQITMSCISSVNPPSDSVVGWEFVDIEKINYYVFPDYSFLRGLELTIPANKIAVGEYVVFCTIKDHKSFRYSGEGIILKILPEVTPIDREPTKKSSSSCPDCVSPTLGTDIHGERFVDYGVTLNGEKFQMGNYKTHIPMMFTEIGQENHLELKIYENYGAYNIDMVQFALVKEIGSSIDFEPRFQIDVKNTANDIHNPALEGIELLDKEGIIDNYSIEPSLVDCMEGYTHTCLKLDIYWTFAKLPENKVIMINGWDNGKSSFSHFLNDGLTVIDPNPIIPEPEPIPEEKECKIYKVPKRIHACQFQPMIDYEIQRAQEYLDSLK